MKARKTKLNFKTDKYTEALSAGFKEGNKVELYHGINTSEEKVFRLEN